MKSKKALLVTNTLSIIIAVIGIMLIFYGAYKLYDNVVNSDNKSAQELLDIIEAKTNALETEEPFEFAIRGFNEEWYLTGWGKEDSDRPEKCFFDSCVCVCTGEDCQTKGICLPIDQSEVKILSFDVVKSQAEGSAGGSYVETIPEKQIKLPKTLFQIEITKTEDSLKIFQFSDLYKQNEGNIIKNTLPI
jgi:hypothetical protein